MDRRCDYTWVGCAAIGLAVRRIGAARSAATRVGRCRLQPAVVGKLLRQREHAGQRERLPGVLGTDPEPSRPARDGRHLRIVCGDYERSERAWLADADDEGEQHRGRANRLLARVRLPGNSSARERADGSRWRQHRPRRAEVLRPVAGEPAAAGEQPRGRMRYHRAVAVDDSRPGDVSRAQSGGADQHHRAIESHDCR